MAQRRSRRTAAAAAESRIARAVEDESEDSNGSNYGADNNSVSSSDDEADATIEEESDTEFIPEEAEVSSKSSKSKANKKGSKATKAPASKKNNKTATTSSSSTTANPVNTSVTSKDKDSSDNAKELSDDSLKCLIRNFRLTDLQALMIYVGKNKAGRKNEMLERACELVDSTNGDIKRKVSEKVQELHSTMFRNMASAPSVNPYAATYRPNTSTGTLNPNENTTAPTTTNNISSAYVEPPPLQTIQTPRYDWQAGVYSTSISQPHSNLVYPTYPDVKLKNLPFYKVDSVLMKPSSLQPRGHVRFQEQTFSFHLTPTQASAIAQSGCRDPYGRQEYKKQIQLRFSLLETSCEQDDNFPASICIKVNGRLQTLPNPIPSNKPGVDPKRPPKPINITHLCKLSSTVPNYINVTWAVEVGSGYTISVYYVEKLSSSDLMDELKQKGKRHADYTRAVIKDKLSDKDNEIATTSCKVTLACPLGKMRMTFPCRASTCDHLQCFDAQLYLMMNEKKPKWVCPVCNKSAYYENLLIGKGKYYCDNTINIYHKREINMMYIFFLDGYFSEVLNSKKLPRGEHEIVLQSDASWDPLVIPKKKDENDAKVKQENESSESDEDSNKKEDKKKDTTTKKEKVETLDLDDDESDEDIPLATFQKNLVPPVDKPAVVPDCVTLDESDDEILPPTSKRPRILEDEESDSVSALTTPSSVTPPPISANNVALNNIHNGGNGSSSPEIICLDDD